MEDKTTFIIKQWTWYYNIKTVIRYIAFIVEKWHENTKLFLKCFYLDSKKKTFQTHAKKSSESIRTQSNISNQRRFDKGNTMLQNTTVSPTTPKIFEPPSDELIALFGMNMTIIILGIIFHTVCILLSWSKNTRTSNQSILLVHFSLVSIVSLSTNIYSTHHKTYSIRFSEQYIQCFYVIYINYILNLMLLTTDRLLLALLSIKYATIVKRRYIFLFLLLSWLAAISYGIVLRYTNFYKNLIRKTSGISLIYNGCVVGYTILSYVVIGVIVNRSAKASGQSSRKSFLSHITPLAIVGSFFFFNVFPALLILWIKMDVQSKSFQYLVVGLIGVNCLNNVTDAILYVFLQRRIRRRFKRYYRIIVNRIKGNGSVADYEASSITYWQCFDILALITSINYLFLMDQSKNVV